ncbi:hypothetical protein [Desulfoluna sp.]|uniref:hypothetical protein n=1 Tax=Desulfoluna sp. TaxID=2045199 RepID=UPI002605DC81|nr:hypothetical protein [Desulfoluna sp.]
MDVSYGSGMEGQPRRRYLVNTRFQVNHILSISVMVIFAFLVISLCMGWFYLHCSDDRLVCHHNATILWRVGIIFLFFMTGMMLWSIRYTRAIAGPIETLCETLKKAENGSFPEHPVRFRRHDLFKRLAAPLTACLTSMQRTRTTLDQTLDRLEALRGDLAQERMVSSEIEEALEVIVRQGRGGA